VLLILLRFWIAALVHTEQSVPMPMPSHPCASKFLSCSGQSDSACVAYRPSHKHGRNCVLATPRALATALFRARRECAAGCRTLLVARLRFVLPTPPSTVRLR